MLKRILIRACKVVVLAGFVVATFVTPGCDYDVTVKYNGHWDGPVCVPNGNKCEVDVKVSSGGDKAT